MKRLHITVQIAEVNLCRSEYLKDKSRNLSDFLNFSLKFLMFCISPVFNNSKIKVDCGKMERKNGVMCIVLKVCEPVVRNWVF